MKYHMAAASKEFNNLYEVRESQNTATVEVMDEQSIPRGKNAISSRIIFDLKLITNNN